MNKFFKEGKIIFKKENFKYFFDLLIAYPKVTLIIAIPSILIPLLVMSAEGDLSLFESVRIFFSQVVIFINFKVWLVAIFRDKLIFDQPGKPFFFVFLMTIILMILAVVIGTPVLGEFVPE